MGIARERVARPRFGEAGLLIPILLFVLLFALVPVALLFGSGWVSGGGAAGLYDTVWREATNRASLYNSLEQGALSALVAFGVGYPAGIFLARYAFPGRTAARSFLLLPFLLPTVVVVVGILDLFGPGGTISSAVPTLAWFGEGVPGIVLANLVFNVPLVVLYTALGCESASGDLEETSRTLGASPARVYRDVWAGPSLIGAAVGVVLTFVFAALAFASPLMICGPRCYTLEAQVYALSSTFLEPTAASLLALAAVLILLVPIVVYVLLASRLRERGSRGPIRPQKLSRSGWIGPAFAIEASLVFAGIAIVLFTVLARSIWPASGGAFGAGWSDLVSSRTTATLGIPIGNVIVNTFGFAVFAAAATFVLVLLAAFALRNRPRWEGSVSTYLFLPLLVSPVLLAFSLAEFWRPILGGESTVWVLIGVSQAILALPFALQSVQVPLSSLSAAPSEAARSLGASRWTAFWDADIPRIRNGIVTAGLFAFAIGLGEFTATYFLYTPAFTTLSVAVYTLQRERFSDATAGAAALLLVVSLAVFAIVLGMGRSRERAHA